MSPETASPIEQLLATPSRRQRNLAERLGLTRCVESGIDAYFAAPEQDRARIEGLLNRLYHWLLEDTWGIQSASWPEKVRGYQSRFYHQHAWEKALQGCNLLAEALLTTPILGPIFLFASILVILVVGILLYLLILPFPFVRRPVDRFLESFGTAMDYHPYSE